MEKMMELTLHEVSRLPSFMLGTVMEDALRIGLGLKTGERVSIFTEVCDQGAITIQALRCPSDTEAHV